MEFFEQSNILVHNIEAVGRVPSDDKSIELEQNNMNLHLLWALATRNDDAIFPAEPLITFQKQCRESKRRERSEIDQRSFKTGPQRCKFSGRKPIQKDFHT
ncbi:hypothetical protein M514_00589 [Trichuris suis]|uniref:Uncharacterized protein n=1 Tax=Trichuris suis TaxID=68888 RepID=A0A085MMB7_9BILA|nr:hypothetical protein M513_00589 [Trichuris suis]KFD61233.1 hypothetical protein M514_00589 [Trichuris suis]